MREHPQQARAGLRDERFHAGCARGFDGGNKPAARREDIEIGHAAHFHLEFIGAVARPDDMCVRVYEAGHENTTPRVESWFIGIGVLEFVGSADCDDLFIARDDRAFFDDAKRTKRFSALNVCKGKKLGSRVYKHVYHQFFMIDHYSGLTQ